MNEYVSPFISLRWPPNSLRKKPTLLVFTNLVLKDQRCGSRDYPKPNSFTTPQRSPAYLRRLVSIEENFFSGLKVTKSSWEEPASLFLCL